MAAAVNRPSPAHSGPNSGSLNSCTDRSVPNFGQQDPRLHDPSQDPGPSSHPQHHIPAQRVLYVPAPAPPPPPQPPFLPYQWPMPLSYNPFAGFPGMGYGMVMPPFPPPPYLGPPAYILPHPHIQPVDYRRLGHPQVHNGSAAYQNQNQTRRIRPVHTVPVRETMNAAVQTESTQRGVSSYSDEILSAASDSGHGTTSNSPYSSSSSSQKRGSPEVENYTLPRDDATDSPGNVACANDTGRKIVQSCVRATVEPQKCRKDGLVQEDNPHYRNGHCNMRSVRSPDSMVPVCSSSQQVDEVAKKRRNSVSDILMSKMADQMLPQNDCELLTYETECEHERSLYCVPPEAKNGPVVMCSADANDHTESVSSSEDSETLFKILKLPFALNGPLLESRNENVLMGLDEPLQSPHEPGEISDNTQETVSETNPDVEPKEIIPYQMPLNISHMKRKMNESVWSVESLAPFTPNEWLQFEPEMAINMTGEGETDRLSTQSDNVIVRSSEQRMNSSLSDSVPSCLTFSTPAEKQRPPKMPKIESEIEAKNLFVSLSCLQSKLILSPQTEEADENGSSEPVANQSPNQESLIVSEQQETMSLCPEQEETLILNSMGGQKVSPVGQQILQNGVDLERGADGACKDKEVSQLRKDQLCVSMADQKRAQVSPLKGNLVDCGIQCTELKCPCEELQRKKGPNRRQPFVEDTRNCGKNQRRNNRLRNRDQEMHSSQQETYRFYGKPGKSKGGMGRY